MNYNFYSQYIIYIAAFAIVMIAQSRVQAAYQRYKKIPNEKGMSGEEVARRILDYNGLQDIVVEVAKGGMLTDHYDPANRVVRLSPDIFYNKSIASISVAAHEVGHAIQHKEHYGAIALRNRLLPAANIASRLGWIVLVLGLFLFVSIPIVLYAGIALICVVLLFQVVTLPVEFNASSRAVKQLAMHGMVAEDEAYEVKSMLRAAAFTYVAAVLSTLAQILRILLMVLGSRRNDN